MKLILFLIFLLFCLLMLSYFDFKYRENFDTSSSDDVSGGASEYYGWGYNPLPERHRRRHHCEKCNEYYEGDEHRCTIIVEDIEKCRNCDITRNKDIDKYVLKSSIPPCPDMSQFATKNMLQPDVNLDDYILKSELPNVCASYYPDKNYMLKTECVPSYYQQQCPDYSQYDITQHPRFKEVIKDKCVKFKQSWISDFESWWDSLFGDKKKDNDDPAGYPQSFSWSPYSGFSTSNKSYLLL
jgi:hypothetical protein